MATGDGLTHCNLCKEMYYMQNGHNCKMVPNDAYFNSIFNNMVKNDPERVSIRLLQEVIDYCDFSGVQYSDWENLLIRIKDFLKHNKN